jgi:hypothetical protein
MINKCKMSGAFTEKSGERMGGRGENNERVHGENLRISANPNHYDGVKQSLESTRLLLPL